MFFKVYFGPIECITLMFKIFTFVKTKYLSSEIVHKNVFAVTEYFRYLFMVLHQLFPSFLVCHSKCKLYQSCIVNV